MVEVGKRIKIRKKTHVYLTGLYVFETNPAQVDAAKNCKKCTDELKKRIEIFNKTNDKSYLEFECECKEKWKEEIKKEYLELPRRIYNFYSMLAKEFDVKNIPGLEEIEEDFKLFNEG